MANLIAPSLMCADLTDLKAEVKDLDDAGVDIFHMDVMDGHYVPNVALGVEDYKAVRQLTETTMDVHLMVENPDDYIDIFASLGPDIIYVHPDTSPMITRTLAHLAELGIKPGIAVNPAISVDQIKELLPIVDYVMVMTVNPGFSGQPFLKYTLPKIQELGRLKRDNKFKLMVDGAIAPERIKQLAPLGVDGFIVGTSSLFGKDRSYAEIVPELKEL